MDRVEKHNRTWIAQTTTKFVETHGPSDDFDSTHMDGDHNLAKMRILTNFRNLLHQLLLQGVYLDVGWHGLQENRF